MFWKLIKDENNNYGYFGIGFMTTGKKSDKNYPNTFFFRSDKQYIYSQESVIPTSLMIIDKMKQVILDIYWEEIRASMVKNPHHKYLISNFELICDEFGNIKQEKIFKCENEDIKKQIKECKLEI